MRTWDVLVVGAGPAGVSAARSAAANGAETILLEKNPKITAVKPCGEATGSQTFETAGISPNPSIILHEVNARVYAPNMEYVDIDEIGYSINKSMFLLEVAKKAAEAGAKIKVRETVSAVEREDGLMRVKSSGETYESKVVIGADGFNSTVAKHVGIREKSEPIPTIQYLMANCELDYPDTARFFLGHEVAPKGYAWIFPRGEKIAEVGIGVRGASAKLYLDRFIERFESELGDAQILDYRGAPVPIGGMIDNNVVDGTILVGDAAGTVVPLTGAGIHASTGAGLVAGEVAAEAAAEGDTSAERLQDFRGRYEDPWGAKIKSSLKVMRALETLPDKDLNRLADVLKGSDILDLANGLDVKRVALKLLSHPVLAMKLARRLM
jgi:digeranylgeranylglycerophospholipid reductase